jgi:polyhydroxyalkanoate synthesis repressor PhaR
MRGYAARQDFHDLEVPPWRVSAALNIMNIMEKAVRYANDRQFPDAGICAAHRAWGSMHAPSQTHFSPTAPEPPMPEPRVIRKYANRRLYDATASRHVTNDDIRRLIAAGERVQVVDDRSGEDLTRTVLLQIIAEQEQFGAPVLSVQLLEGIIRFYGNPVQDLLSRYLEQSLGTVMQQQRTVQEQIAKVMEGPLAPLAPLAELTRQNMEMWNRMQNSMLAALTPRSQRQPGAPDSSDAADEPAPGAAGSAPTDPPTR